METSVGKVDERQRKMRRRAEVAGENQGVVFRRLLDAVVEVLGGELVELHEEVRALEAKIDSHFGTLRTDISHVRQSTKRVAAPISDTTISELK